MSGHYANWATPPPSFNNKKNGWNETCTPDPIHSVINEDSFATILFFIGGYLDEHMFLNLGTRRSEPCKKIANEQMVMCRIILKSLMRQEILLKLFDHLNCLNCIVSWEFCKIIIRPNLAFLSSRDVTFGIIYLFKLITSNII